MASAATAAATAAATSASSAAPATSPESEEIAAVALAAERALRELDAAISSSLELSEMSDDPASAQVLVLHHWRPASVCISLSAVHGSMEMCLA